MFEGPKYLASVANDQTSKGVGMTDRGLDEPVPDAVEQSQEAVPGADDSDQTELPDQLPLEANEADAAEQAREVELGEEDYR
jgi:hypothetical protein